MYDEADRKMIFGFRSTEFTTGVFFEMAQMRKIK